jgi:glycosyltransferase involved in cell wall biosynthesis
MAGGGGEKVMAMIANHLDNMGWDVDIVMLLSNKCNREHFQLSDSINTIDLSPSSNSNYLSNCLFWLKGIRKTIKEQTPDLVISFFGRINALVLTAAYSSKVPIIVSERSDPHHDRRGKIMFHYCDWIYKRANALVFQTEYQKNCFSKRHYNRSYIVPNPIIILPLPEKDIDPYLVMTTGRLHPDKNHLMLIRAINLVRKEIPQVHCVIYGDGSMETVLQNKINELQLEGIVTLGGKQSHITDYVGRCGVFVMTSNHEGLSNSIMEAMMLGKVCISTDYPGVEDLIIDNETGYVIPRDDVKCLALAIINAIKDSDNRGSLIRKKAREKMIKYDSNSILNKWDNVIARVLK